MVLPEQGLTLVARVTLKHGSSELNDWRTKFVYAPLSWLEASKVERENNSCIIAGRTVVGMHRLRGKIEAILTKSQETAHFPLPRDYKYFKQNMQIGTDLRCFSVLHPFVPDVTFCKFKVVCRFLSWKVGQNSKQGHDFILQSILQLLNTGEAKECILGVNFTKWGFLNMDLWQPPKHYLFVINGGKKKKNPECYWKLKNPNNIVMPELLLKALICGGIKCCSFLLVFNFKQTWLTEGR